MLAPDMLILGLDTSGRQGSVALLHRQGGAQGGELALLGESVISGGQYSELLLPVIAELLARHGLQRRGIGLIGVASGPGSFTGLRIAIATVKGLAEVFATPVVAVSVLEAVADASGAAGRVIVAIDAQRSEVFWGEYEVEPANQSATMLSEALASFADFTSRCASTQAPPPNDNEEQVRIQEQNQEQDQLPHPKLAINASLEWNIRGSHVFTHDEALAARFREAGVDAGVVASPSAEAFARIAYRKFRAGVRADVATLDANYLRRSDAELFSAPKRGVAPR